MYHLSVYVVLFELDIFVSMFVLLIGLVMSLFDHFRCFNILIDIVKKRVNYLAVEFIVS